MSAAIAAAVAPAIVDFASWASDIGGRLLRGEMDAEQALAEMEQRRAECMAEVDKAKAKTTSDRAALDEAARLKFAAAPAPALTPAAPPPIPAAPAAPPPGAAPTGEQ